jgi:DNA-binding NtrC family response regulator
MAMVLIVEDDEQVRVLADGILQETGHNTLTAGSVTEALALIKGDGLVDVLFTDIGLEDQLHGGLQLAKEAVEVRPELAVVYTTGKGVTDGMRALFVPRFAFVAKPYTAADLTAAIDNAMEVN